LGTVDYESAEREYRTALSLAPNNLKALVGAAALYGPPESNVTIGEAIQWLEEVTRLDPLNALYHARLGEFYHEVGRTEEAIKAWQKALVCPRPLETGYVRSIQRAIEMV